MFVERIVQMVLSLIIGVPLALALSSEISKAAIDCPEPLRSLTLLVFDPTEFVLKWLVAAIGLLALVIHRASSL